VIRAADNSLLELDTGTGGIVTVHGPKSFRADLARMRSRMDSGGALYSLYRNFSRKVQHRPPITIVASVRSGEAAADARKVRRDFEDALTFFNADKDEDAWLIFSRIAGSPYLTSMSKEQLKYYRAEILFRKEKYAEALPIYDELSGSRIEGFSYREDAHARAILCAEHAGRYERMSQLVGEYLARYSAGGKYTDSIKELSGGDGALSPD
jgi:tetratricopeptide (TPR) repeat protein